MSETGKADVGLVVGESILASLNLVNQRLQETEQLVEAANVALKNMPILFNRAAETAVALFSAGVENSGAVGSTSAASFGIYDESNATTGQNVPGSGISSLLSGMEQLIQASENEAGITDRLNKVWESIASSIGKAAAGVKAMYTGKIVPGAEDDDDTSGGSSHPKTGAAPIMPNHQPPPMAVGNVPLHHVTGGSAAQKVSGSEDDRTSGEAGDEAAPDESGTPKAGAAPIAPNHQPPPMAVGNVPPHHVPGGSAAHNVSSSENNGTSGEAGDEAAPDESAHPQNGTVSIVQKHQPPPLPVDNVPPHESLVPLSPEHLPVAAPGVMNEGGSSEGKGGHEKGKSGTGEEEKSGRGGGIASAAPLIFGVGKSVFQLEKHSLKLAGQSQQTTTDEQAEGVSPAQIAMNNAAAWSAANGGVTDVSPQQASSALDMLSRVLGSNVAAGGALDPFLKTFVGLQGLVGAKAASSLWQGVGNLQISGGKVEGTDISVQQAIGLLPYISEAAVQTQGALAPAQILGLMQNAGPSVNADLFKKMLEDMTAVTKLAGQKAGLGVLAADTSLSTGQVSAAMAHNLEQLGLLKPSQLQHVKGSSSYSFDPHDLYGAQDLQKNGFMDWLHSIIIPYLKKRGDNTPQDIAHDLSAILPVSIAGQVSVLVSNQIKSVQKTEKNTDKGGKTDAVYNLSEQLYTIQLDNLNKAWGGVLTSLGLPAIKLATEDLKGLSDGIHDFTAWFVAHPTAAAVIDETLYEIGGAIAGLAVVLAGAAVVAMVGSGGTLDLVGLAIGALGAFLVQIPWEKMPGLIAQAAQAILQFCSELAYMATHPLAALMDFATWSSTPANDKLGPAVTARFPFLPGGPAQPDGQAPIFNIHLPSDNSLRAAEIDLFNYYTLGIVPGPMQSLLFPTPSGRPQPVIPTATPTIPSQLTHSTYTASSVVPLGASSTTQSVVFLPKPLVPPAPPSAQGTSQTAQPVQMPWFWGQQSLASGAAEPSIPPAADYERVYNVRVVNPRDIHNGVAQSFTQQLMGVQTGPTGYDYSFGHPAPAGAW